LHDAADDDDEGGGGEGYSGCGSLKGSVLVPAARLPAGMVIVVVAVAVGGAFLSLSNREG